jgi:hypothetical protein
MSLRACHRTVTRVAVAQFLPDMEVKTGAHVHVQVLKMLTFSPCTRSAIKHVDPCTGSLASPLHAPSPSSSSTLVGFGEFAHRFAKSCPFVSVPVSKGVVETTRYSLLDIASEDLDRNYRISVPSGGRAQTVAYMAKWLLNRCCLCPNPVQICIPEKRPIFPLLAVFLELTIIN